jgi:hypothetical protein
MINLEATMRDAILCPSIGLRFFLISLLATVGSLSASSQNKSEMPAQLACDTSKILTAMDQVAFVKPLPNHCVRNKIDRQPLKETSLGKDIEKAIAVRDQFCSMDQRSFIAAPDGKLACEVVGKVISDATYLYVVCGDGEAWETAVLATKIGMSYCGLSAGSVEQVRASLTAQRERLLGR